jgi:hypothetical protein
MSELFKLDLHVASNRKNNEKEEEKKTAMQTTI